MGVASITRWYVGGIGSRLYRGVRGITHGAQALVGLLETDEVAFAGIGGECSYNNVYITLTRSNTALWPLTITPIVDGVEQAAITVDLEPVGSLTRETLEISLMQPHTVASVVRSRYAARGARFALRLELGQSGQTLFYSGEPVELSTGKWAGGTHFSEFALQASLPTGLTFLDGGGNSPDKFPTFEILDDVAEGRYVKCLGNPTANPSNRYVVMVDSFNDLFGGVVNQEIEVLCRGYLSNAAAGGPAFPGPATNLASAGGADPARGNVVMSQYNTASDLEMRLSKAEGANMAIADYPDGEATGWVWQRLYLQWTGGTNWVRRVRSWHGALSAEPGTWQIDQTLSDANMRTALGSIGFGQGSGLLSTHEGRIAFLSFSMDPSTQAPPLPSEVLEFAAPAAEDPPNIDIDGIEVDFDVEVESLDPATESV
jgi:hypothetical protein